MVQVHGCSIFYLIKKQRESAGKSTVCCADGRGARPESLAADVRLGSAIGAGAKRIQLLWTHTTRVLKGSCAK